MITLPAPARRRRGVARLSADRGTSAVEYGLLVAAITAVVAAIVFSVGIKVKTAFDDTCHSIVAAKSTGTQPTGLRALMRDTCS